MEINKIYNMDCEEGLKLLDSNSIDLVITSPPYNCRKKYDEWDDDIPEKEYLLKMNRIIKELYRVMKDDGRVCWNVADLLFPLSKSEDPKAWAKESQPRAAQFTNIFINDGFKLYSNIIWHQRDNNNLTAWGSWKSASCPHITSTIEYFLIFYKKYKRKLRKGESTITSKEFIECCKDNVWKISPMVTKKRTEYCPVPFPRKIVYKLINLFSYKNDIVMDPFAGSGIVLSIAKECRRKYIGFELSKKYCEQIKEKLAQGVLFE